MFACHPHCKSKSARDEGIAPHHFLTGLITRPSSLYVKGEGEEARGQEVFYLGGGENCRGITDRTLVVYQVVKRYTPQNWVSELQSSEVSLPKTILYHNIYKNIIMKSVGKPDVLFHLVEPSFFFKFTARVK